MIKSKQISLGWFDNEIDASQAYKDKLMEIGEKPLLASVATEKY